MNAAGKKEGLKTDHLLTIFFLNSFRSFNKTKWFLIVLKNKSLHKKPTKINNNKILTHIYQTLLCRVMHFAFPFWYIAN